MISTNVKSRRRALSLIEIMIVMALVGLISSVIAVNVKGWVQQERFRSSVGRVQEALNTAQDLMLIAGADAEVKLTRHSNGDWTCRVLAVDALPLRLERLLGGERPLAGIQSLHFLDQDGSESQRDISLPFLSHGSRMAQGRLTLKGIVETRDLYLPGYPRRIALGRVEESEDWRSESDALYPHSVLEEAPAASAT